MFTIIDHAAVWDPASRAVRFRAEAAGRTLRFAIPYSVLEQIDDVYLRPGLAAVAAFGRHLERIHVAAERKARSGWPSPALGAYVLTSDDFEAAVGP